jgi:hypothetical protein
VIVHAADVQDADSAGDFLRRLKRLYPWLKAVFADSGAPGDRQGVGGESPLQ